MNVFPAVLMSSAYALRVVTLLLLAALAIPTLDQQELADSTLPLDR